MYVVFYRLLNEILRCIIIRMTKRVASTSKLQSYYARLKLQTAILENDMQQLLQVLWTPITLRVRKTSPNFEVQSLETGIAIIQPYFAFMVFPSSLLSIPANFSFDFSSSSRYPTKSLPVVPFPETPTPSPWTPRGPAGARLPSTSSLKTGRSEGRSTSKKYQRESTR